MTQPGTGTILKRKFGRYDVTMSALGFGGHHLGNAVKDILGTIGNTGDPFHRQPYIAANVERRDFLKDAAAILGHTMVPRAG